MSDERFSLKEWEDLNYCEHCFYDGENQLSDSDVVDLLNEKQEQLDLYKEAILTMLGLLADKGIIFSGVKDE